jgi:hypothetical protein
LRFWDARRQSGRVIKVRCGSGKRIIARSTRRSEGCDAVIRVYDEAGNVIESGTR